ncbi:MAG: response regulator [Pirellulaceae bacterium]|nr:response regulator [Pirellulaceae bacterium]
MAAIRVLIADQDQVLLETYKRFLADRDVEPSFAVSGLDCIGCLRDSCPDVLVLDPDLHWGDGAGVLERMYGDPRVPTVPVILTSDARDAEQLSLVRKYPFEVFMIKPVSPQEVLKKIRGVHYSARPESHPNMSGSEAAARCNSWLSDMRYSPA